MAQDQSVESRGLRIPPWALWILGAFIPWSMWVTYTVMQLQFTGMSKVDGDEIVTKVEQKVEAGYEKLAAKFESLQRDFDRNFGKQAPNP